MQQTDEESPLTPARMPTAHRKIAEVRDVDGKTAAGILGYEQNESAFLKLFWFDVIKKAKVSMETNKEYWEDMQKQAILHLTEIEEFSNTPADFTVVHHIRISQQWSDVIEAAIRIKTLISHLHSAEEIDDHSTSRTIEDLKEENKIYRQSFLSSFPAIWANVIGISAMQASMNHGIDGEFWNQVQKQGFARLEAVEKLVEGPSGLNSLDDRMEIWEHWLAAMEFSKFCKRFNGEYDPEYPDYDQNGNLNAIDKRNVLLFLSN